MPTTIRLGTAPELNDAALVAIVVRKDDDGFHPSTDVRARLVDLNIPEALTAEWGTARGLTESVGSSCLFRSFRGPDVLLISGGSETANDLDEWRQIGACAQRAAAHANVWLALALDEVTDPRSVGQAVAEGATLASYAYDDDGERTSEFVVVPVGGLPTVTFHDDLERGVNDGTVVASAFNWSKHLINTPAGDLSPKVLAKEAVRKLSSCPFVTVDSWSAPKIEDERLGGLLGVSAGSAQPPRLVYATYDPEPGSELAHVALVGKGITFDSGGLSIKTGDGMMTMKTDMAGAATVFGVLAAASTLGLRVRLTVIAPLTENLIGPRATKPGDVLKIRNGLTIEVLNTDAEGRLVLADGLSLAVEAQPDAIIDIATLTGAQRVALGDEIGAVFASEDDLAAQIAAASDVSGEPFCRLPLHDGYESHFASDVADLKNIGKPQNAGAVIAALILRRFTGDLPWAHFDVAGPMRCDAARGYYTKGATAFGGRTILEYLRLLEREASDPVDAAESLTIQ